MGVRILAVGILFAVLSGPGMAQSSNRASADGLGASASSAVLIADCGSAGGAAEGRADDSKSRGFDLANLDRSVSPCADFYQFADGGWMKSHPIPPAYPRWGSFTELQEHNQEVLHSILEEAAKDKAAKPGSNRQKIGDFYASCMDESQIEAAGLKPLEAEFAKIAKIKDSASLQAEVARLQTAGVNAIFGIGSEPDFKNSSQMIAAAGQGGLGLPDRDYYTRDDDKSKQLRADYVQHVTNIFKLLGDSDAAAAAEAKTVMDIETRLAKASMIAWTSAIRTRCITRCRSRNFTSWRPTSTGKAF